MEKFEYKIIEAKFEINYLNDELNSLGSEGWELINVLSQKNENSSDLTYFIFKRNITKESFAKRGFIRGADYYADVSERKNKK